MAEPPLLESVRTRANFACEYCGVTETDAGGLLTMDHFRPRSAGGSDDAANLVYCCPRCNLHKAAYWPSSPSDPSLWNPRQEPRENHCLLLADGRLYPITPTGRFAVERLQLNRAPLVQHRRESLRDSELAKSFQQLKAVLAATRNLQNQQSEFLEEYRLLLRSHRELLQTLITWIEST